MKILLTSDEKITYLFLIASDIDEKIIAFSLPTIRGRRITPTVLEEIRGVINTCRHAGRSVISRVLCEQWNWRQSNGLLKDMACRGLLLRLERLGLIALPPRRRVKSNYKRIPPIPPAFEENNLPRLDGRVDCYRRMTIDMVRGSEKEILWDARPSLALIPNTSSLLMTTWSLAWLGARRLGKLAVGIVSSAGVPSSDKNG